MFRDASAGLATHFDTLATELFRVVVAGTTARLDALLLHSMTAKRLAGMEEPHVVASGAEVLTDAHDFATVAAMDHLMDQLCDTQCHSLPSWKDVLLPELQHQRNHLRSAVQYELRHQCYYYLTKLTPAAYHDQSTELQEADAAVRTFANNVVAFIDAIPHTATLPLLLGNIAQLVCTLMLACVRSMPRIDAGGMLKMHMNVFCLQQRLSPLLQNEEDDMHFERISEY